MIEQIKKQSLSPKFFFLSLGVLVSLIVSVVSVALLFSETLKKVMPDVLNAYYAYDYSYTYESMRVALATLIIAFPIYLILSYFWTKVRKKEIFGWDTIILKWLIYFILFLAVIFFAIDFASLVKSFVAGELTARFALKVLATVLVTGSAWIYYFSILKDFERDKNKKILQKSFFVFFTILVLGVIIFAFRVMGSPSTQRALKLDSRRVSDLQSIQWQVIDYWQQKSVMPEKLSDLEDPLRDSNLPLDPEFQKGKVYEYNPKEGLTFELCAEFSAPATKSLVEGGYAMPIATKDVKYMALDSVTYREGMTGSWDHGEGRVCFERTIDPDIYKPYEK